MRKFVRKRSIILSMLQFEQLFGCCSNMPELGTIAENRYLFWCFVFGVSTNYLQRNTPCFQSVSVCVWRNNAGNIWTSLCTDKRRPSQFQAIDALKPWIICPISTHVATGWNIFQKCPTSRSLGINVSLACHWYDHTLYLVCRWRLGISGIFSFFLVSFRGKAKGCRVFKGTFEPQESFACGLDSDLIHWSKISQSIPIRDFASFSLLLGHYPWCFGSRWFAHETDWTPWNCPEIVGCNHDIPAWVQGEAYHLEAEMKDWMGLYRREHLLSTSAPFSVLLTAKDGAVYEVFFFKRFWLR